MAQVLLLRLLVVVAFVILAETAQSRPQRHRQFGLSFRRELATILPTKSDCRKTTSFAIDASLILRGGGSEQLDALRFRGGGGSRQIEIDNDDDDSSVVVKKLRNIVRSLLRSTEEGSAVHSALQSFFRGLESIFGVRLLPRKPKKKAKKQRKQKSKQTASQDEAGNVEEEATSSTSTDRKKRTVAGDSLSSSSTKMAATKTKRKVGSQKKQPSSSSKTISAAAAVHLQKDLKSTNPNYRIQRELKAFIKDPPEHLKVTVGKNMRIWIVTMEGVGIYEGETFQLRIKFPPNYPTRPPSVYFLPPNIPVHEHVYTNGDICLSLLGKDWRPTMTAQSIAHSILSILASAQTKSLPMDNSRHAQNKPGGYQEDWVYHDDNC